jgi:hypothetical protein
LEFLQPTKNIEVFWGFRICPGNGIFQHSNWAKPLVWQASELTKKACSPAQHLSLVMVPVLSFCFLLVIFKIRCWAFDAYSPLWRIRCSSSQCSTCPQCLETGVWPIYPFDIYILVYTNHRTMHGRRVFFFGVYFKFRPR